VSRKGEGNYDPEVIGRRIKKSRFWTTASSVLNVRLAGTARSGHPGVRFAVRVGSELRRSCSGIHIIVEVVRRHVALRTPVNNRLRWWT
jgi:hypothetical protein